MFNIIKKKLGLLVLVIFVVISIKNINKFNDFGMLEMSEQDNTVELDSIIENSSINLNILDESENFENLKKFELTKKIVPPKINKSPYIESLNLANYSDKQSASDYFVDEKNLNLTLVPVSETMLFSGIPEPEVKPIPEKPNHYKATTISVKNKKSLKKNLAKFLEKKKKSLSMIESRIT